MPKRRWIDFLIGAVILLVIAVHAQYLWDTRTTLPHVDDWGDLDRMFTAKDHGELAQWLFATSNGHVLLPANLAYLISLHFFSLNLTWMRLLNLPICWISFVLAVQVNRRVNGSFAPTSYLHLAAALVIFNLCYWEHFTLATGFSFPLAAMLGGVGLSYVASGSHSKQWTMNGALAVLFITAAMLTAGVGYAAPVAAIGLILLTYLSRWTGDKFSWRAKALAVLLGVVIAAGVLSNPRFGLPGPVMPFLYRFLLVLGSIVAASLGKSTETVLAAYLFGLIVLGASCYAVYDFVVRARSCENSQFPFAAGMIIFGLAASAAVSFVRPGLPMGEFISSRYTTNAAICLLGLLWYSAQVNSFVLAHVWCLIGAGYLAATIPEWPMRAGRQIVYENMAQVIAREDQVSDAELQAALYWQWDTAGVRRVIQRLKRERLNVFQDDALLLEQDR